MVKLQTILITSRVFAALLSVPLLCMAFFSYEGEAGRLHNRLEEAWIRVQERSAKVHTRQVALVMVLSRLLLEICATAFGRSKKRSFAIFVGYFVFSVFISAAGYHGVARAVRFRRADVGLPIVFFVALCVSRLHLRFNVNLLRSVTENSNKKAIFAGLCWDYCLLLGIGTLAHFYYPRHTHDWLIRVYRLYHDSFWLVDNKAQWLHHEQARYYVDFLTSMPIVTIAIYLPVALFAPGLMSLSILGVAGLVAVNGLLWSAVSRPLYGLQKWEILKNNTRQLLAGFALLTWALGDVLAGLAAKLK